MMRGDDYGGDFYSQEAFACCWYFGNVCAACSKIRRVVCSGCEPSYSGDASYTEFSDAYQMGCRLLKEEQPLVLYMDD